MTAIADPAQYFKALAGLHDAIVAEANVDLEARTLTLAIADLDAAFANPPVAVPRAGLLIFNDVSRLRLGLDLGEGVRIGELSVVGQAGAYQLNIALSLGGIPDDPAAWWVSAQFASLDISETRQ